jgi:hypothetical protein
MAVAMEWVGRIWAVALMMVLPGLAGYWLDQRLHTRVVFLILGLGLGCTTAMWYLIQITKVRNGRK